nr:Arm DNA-binding domain-containing protein [Sphingomonas chungangi]
MTAIDARNAKPAEREYKLYDSKGLFLLVTKHGNRSWRFKYRYGPKEKLLTFGLYPEVSLAGAREQRDQAREVLRAGKDPGVEALKLKQALIAAAATTFKAVGEAWFEDELPGWSTSHAKRVKFRLEKTSIWRSENCRSSTSTAGRFSRRSARSSNAALSKRPSGFAAMSLPSSSARSAIACSTRR